MTMENTPGPSHIQEKVFKKSSPNNKLTMYLASRDLVVSAGRVDKLSGVVLVDPEFVEDRRVYGQVTLTFRYGREDEEVMGLKFCNEAVMCLTQLYPPQVTDPDRLPPNTPLQNLIPTKYNSKDQKTLGGKNEYSNLDEYLTRNKQRTKAKREMIK